MDVVYRFFALFFRRRRMRQFALAFGIQDATRVIDLGGTPFNWTLIEQKPRVTMVNIEDGPGTADAAGSCPGDQQLQLVFYDGTVVPFADSSFDVCYSNSVIEHVGDWSAVQRFASEVKRLAARYFVQTPNRWFFAEPHFICLFIHWLPMRLLRRLVRWSSIWGLLTRPDQQTIDEALAEIRPLTVSEMRVLFPEAEIVRERFLGMTKSIIAIRR